MQAPQQSACAVIAPTGFVPPKGWAYYERNEPASSSMCNPRGPPVKAPPQGATSVRSVPVGKLSAPQVKAPPKVGDSLQSVPMGRLLAIGWISWWPACKSSSCYAADGP